MNIEHDVEQKVRSFIVEELNYEGDPEALTDDAPLIENQVLDSLGIFQMVSYLEAEFDVSIEDEELVPQNFGSIGSLAAFIRSKQEQ